VESESTSAAGAAGKVQSAKTWGGYAWFMSFGTLLPLPVFLCGYAVHVTIVGTPLAQALYRFGIFLSTLGQPPPGEDKVKERTEGADKKPFAQRIRPYAPPGWVERRGRPVPMAARIVWFVLVGWWLGVIWVVLAWSILLLPYPLPGIIRDLLADLPSVMTLAQPKPLDRAATPEPEPTATAPGA
jgi:uncharacterized membrane protein YccF (DUF307 family)